MIPSISTHFFTYSGKDKTFSGFVSDLSAACYGTSTGVNEVIAPAFNLISEKTERAKMFVRKKTLRNAEGDIEGWEYYSVNGYVEYKLVIFND